MVGIANLRNEFALRVTQVEIRGLAVEELTRDSADGQHGDISLGSLSLEFCRSKQFLGRQSCRQEPHHHSLLFIGLLNFRNLRLASFMIVAPVLLVCLLQIVGHSITAVLHTIEQ